MTATNQTVQGCFLLQLGIVDVVHRTQALFKDFADSQQYPADNGLTVEDGKTYTIE